MEPTLILRPDAKGRITLGALARGVSSFHATADESGRIILEPFAEVPAREKWLFGNQDAMAAVSAGLHQAGEGRTSSRGCFARFANDDIE